MPLDCADNYTIQKKVSLLSRDVEVRSKSFAFNWGANFSSNLHF